MVLNTHVHYLISSLAIHTAAPSCLQHSFNVSEPHETGPSPERLDQLLARWPQLYLGLGQLDAHGYDIPCEVDRG